MVFIWIVGSSGVALRLNMLLWLLGNNLTHGLHLDCRIFWNCLASQRRFWICSWDFVLLLLSAMTIQCFEFLFSEDFLESPADENKRSNEEWEHHCNSFDGFQGIEDAK